MGVQVTACGTYLPARRDTAVSKPDALGFTLTCQALLRKEGPADQGARPNPWWTCSLATMTTGKRLDFKQPCKPNLPFSISASSTCLRWTAHLFPDPSMLEPLQLTRSATSHGQPTRAPVLGSLPCNPGQTPFPTILLRPSMPLLGLAAKLNACTSVLSGTLHPSLTPDTVMHENRSLSPGSGGPYHPCKRI
jgi:hypothetical protein